MVVGRTTKGWRGGGCHDRVEGGWERGIGGDGDTLDDDYDDDDGRPRKRRDGGGKAGLDFWLYGRDDDDTTIKVGGWLTVGISHMPWRYGVSCQAKSENYDLEGTWDQGHKCYRW